MYYILFSYFFYRIIIKIKTFNDNPIIPIKNTTKIILASFSKFKKEDEITTIDYVDTKSLEEIKQLTEYKIRPKE